MFRKVTGGTRMAPAMGDQGELRGDRPLLSPADAANEATIGATIVIKGEITGDENLVIEGTLDGTANLSDRNLTIAQTGRILGNVSANSITVEGEIQGNITASERVFVAKTGKVLGDIVAPKVSVEGGAKFTGRIDMDTKGGRVVRPSGPKRSETGARPAAAETSEKQA